MFEKADNEAAFEEALKEEKGFNASDSADASCVFKRHAQQGCDLPPRCLCLVVDVLADG